MVPVVIIPVLNRYDLLAKCIGSIDYGVEKLIVINNGKGKVEAFDNPFIKTSYIWDMPSNLGVATSWNLGIKSTPFALGWILLNSDAWFLPDKLEKFSRECDSIQILLTGDPRWACAWIGSEVVKDVGLFCEAFHPAYFEDNDYERRAVRLGYTPTEFRDIVMHENSSTLLSDVSLQAKNAETFRVNHELFKLRNARLDAGEWDLQRRLNLSWD